jgi:hypothetical protein
METVKKAINDSKQVNSSWKVLANAEYWIMTGCIKYFVDTKRPKELNHMIMYLSCAIYASLIYKYFRGFTPTPAIMEYTINNLSNRYDIKKLGSIYAVLDKVSAKNHDTYKDYFLDKNFCDRRIFEYIMNLNTRINNFLKEIKNAYEKNRQSGHYMNSERDVNDEENFRENDNLSFTVERLSTKVSNKIITVGINNMLAESAAKMGGVSVSAVRETVYKIVKEETVTIKEFINLYLQQYLVVDNHPVQTISSKQYLTYANRIYTKSNTNDKGVIRMKEILDDWLTKNCEKYVKTERAASKGGYRKAIFLYFALAVQAVLNSKY